MLQSLEDYYESRLLNPNRSVKLWTGFDDGSSIAVSLHTNGTGGFWFSIKVDDEVYEVAIKPSQLHNILERRDETFESVTCLIEAEFSGDMLTFTCDCRRRIVFRMNVNKLGLLLKGLGLEAPKT